MADLRLRKPRTCPTQKKVQDWFFRNHEPPPPERSERSSPRSHECRSLVTFKELVVLLCQVLTCNAAPHFYSAPTRPRRRVHAEASAPTRLLRPVRADASAPTRQFRRVCADASAPTRLHRRVCADASALARQNIDFRSKFLIPLETSSKKLETKSSEITTFAKKYHPYRSCGISAVDLRSL